jgi:heat shock protein HtpX
MTAVNQLKTLVLLALLTALALWVGNFFGTSGLIIAVVFVLFMNGLSYFFSDRLVLMMYRTKRAERKDYPRLFNIVERLANQQNLPMPKIFIIPSANPNAFATGRNPRHASVAATTGILDLLSENELEGVMAHELSHVKNRDILIVTVAATIAGIISYAAAMARWAAIFGGFGGRDSNNNIVSLLVITILTPILALLIQLAISRSREYLADSSAAKMLGTGQGLASALEKLEYGAKKSPMRFGSETTSSLFIVNPFRGNAILNLLSTHPPIKERIRRLRNF